MEMRPGPGPRLQRLVTVVGRVGTCTQQPGCIPGAKHGRDFSSVTAKFGQGRKLQVCLR
jgi:hypothetical protein